MNKHDELLLRDLKLQPIGLLAAYILLGILAVVTGLLMNGILAKWLCVGGGFLVALGAEKLVSRRVRLAALSIIQRK
jgi:hypothetical protein